MIGQNGTRKSQMIGQHGTIVPQMIDDQMINGNMINVLSMFKFILLQYLVWFVLTSRSAMFISKDLRAGGFYHL